MDVPSARREQIRQHIQLEVEEAIERHEGRGRVVVHAGLRRPVVLQRGRAPALQRQQAADAGHRRHHYRDAAESNICETIQ